MTPVTQNDIFTYIYKIQLNFDNSYQTSSVNERTLLIASWYEILCDYPKEICDKAVTNALRKAKFAPRIGDIVEEIEKLLNADKKSDEQLWAELMDVCPKVYDISRYLPYEQYFNNATKKLNEIYDGLSDDLKLFVVNLSTLIEISELTPDNLIYERARFFRQMPLLRKHDSDAQNAKAFLAAVEKPKKIAAKSSKKDDKK